MDESNFTFIDTLEDLVALNEKLCKLSEFAVDLEVRDWKIASCMPTRCNVIHLNSRATDGVFVTLKMLTSWVRKALIQFCAELLCMSRSYVNTLFSTTASLLQEFPRSHQSDADLHQRGGLYHRHVGAPQRAVHPERGVHWPGHCQGNGVICKSFVPVSCWYWPSTGKIILHVCNLFLEWAQFVWLFLKWKCLFHFIVVQGLFHLVHLKDSYVGCNLQLFSVSICWLFSHWCI